MQSYVLSRKLAPVNTMGLLARHTYGTNSINRARCISFRREIQEPENYCREILYRIWVSTSQISDGRKGIIYIFTDTFAANKMDATDNNR